MRRGVPLVTALALVAACTGTAQRSSAPTLHACTVAQVAARCGQVKVPEDWGRPDRATLSLRVVVLPAQTDQRVEDPLVYLDGFGGAATQRAAQARSTFWRLNQTRDILLVDQRGTGASGRLTCSGLTSVRTRAQASAAVTRCLASVKGAHDPRHDTTPAAVEDLDRVRQVLGYSRVDLYGVSYGVSSGLAYLQRHGDRVRAAVLDSGSLLDVRLWEQTPVHAQQAFDRLARRCAASAACRRYEPAADLAAVLRRLRGGPVHVSADVMVDVVAFLDAVVDDYLAAPETAVLLPRDLHAAAEGDFGPMVRRHVAAGSGDGDSTQLQMLTLRCSDAWAVVDAARVRAQRTAFAPMMLDVAATQQALCSVWPHDAGASGVVRAGAPVVFVNGTVDPVDPPANVAAARATMPSSLSVAVPDVGHGAVSRDCLASEATTFLQLGVPAEPARWQACATSLPLPDFPAG